MKNNAYIYKRKQAGFQKRYFPFIASLLIHFILFIPPVRISFHKLFYKQPLTPPPAVIQFRFFAPEPRKESRPQKPPELKQDPAALSRKNAKVLPEEQKQLQELIESMESKRKSTALKTVVPLEKADKEKIQWDYALFIQKTIQRHLLYPESEKNQHIEESVRVTFCIDKTGQLIGKPKIPVIYRSRYENFNISAIQAVLRASSSFPPLPHEIEKDRQYFDIVIEFREP